VVLFLTALGLDVVATPPVDGGAATLEFIVANKPVYIAQQILWIAPSILAVLVFVALFVALGPAKKSLALIATVVGVGSWALFLGSPVTSIGSLNLVYLSDQYRLALTEADRLRFASAAEAIIAANNTPAIVGVLSVLGILLISVAMLGSGFPRALPWLGVAAGLAGLAGEVLRYAVPPLYSVYGLLMWAWFVWTGIALIRLGLRTPWAGQGLPRG